MVSGQQGQLLLRAVRKKIFECISPSFWGIAGNLDDSQLLEATPQFLPFFSPGILPVCISASKFSFTRTLVVLD